ncbi:MAG TPA: TRAP transporter fused permease subunit [Rhodocyclaceae bacterium]|nr:TRAP transporter fused permease subunit [Rhodocyclaceae bacterium]
MNRFKLLDAALLVVGLAAFGYHMLTAQYALVGSYEHQTIHLAFVLTLIFLSALRVAKTNLSRALNGGLLLLGLFVTGYVLVNMAHLEMVIGFPDTRDVIVGMVLILVVMAGTRHAWGMMLPIVAAIFVAYFLWGHHLPGPLWHREFTLNYVISYLSIGLSGIFGSFLSISANFVFLFVVFGALLEIIKVNDLFYELGKAAGRVFKGGPGQTAVVSSALVGTVTGAAVANVAITGAFTIPYMKRSGYPSHVAAAIEATASTGGQLMPPIMGAAAFLMASFMGVPYATVMLAALIPALLYFWGCILSVQLIAVGADLESPAEPVDKKMIMRRLPLFLVPLTLLVVMLLLHYSPRLAAFWAIIVAISLSCLSRDTRPSPLELARCLARGALVGAQIGIALAIVGLMAQTLITTGLGSKIAGLVELLSGGQLWIALIITMLVSIILGLGIPTSAAYALVAIVVVPSLISMGVTPIAAHFFAFYFAVISAVTPPVALAALAGAGIAGANYMATSLMAFKIAIAGFIIPFLVVYNPVLVLEPRSWTSAVGAMIAIPLGMTALATALFNCGLVGFRFHERLLATACAALMFGYVMFRQIEDIPIEYGLLAAGLLAFMVLLGGQIKRKKAASGAHGGGASVGTSPRAVEVGP